MRRDSRYRWALHDSARPDQQAEHGRQILFVEAGAAIHRGQKVGLAGPNGAGKSTVFGLITGEEQPDDGQISIDRGVTIGYFNQDVGEMAGADSPDKLERVTERPVSDPLRSGP